MPNCYSTDRKRFLYIIDLFLEKIKVDFIKEKHYILVNIIGKHLGARITNGRRDKIFEKLYERYGQDTRAVMTKIMEGNRCTVVSRYSGETCNVFLCQFVGHEEYKKFPPWHAEVKDGRLTIMKLTCDRLHFKLSDPSCKLLHSRTYTLVYDISGIKELLYIHDDYFKKTVKIQPEKPKIEPENKIESEKPKIEPENKIQPEKPKIEPENKIQPEKPKIEPENKAKEYDPEKDPNYVDFKV